MNAIFLFLPIFLNHPNLKKYISEKTKVDIAGTSAVDKNVTCINSISENIFKALELPVWYGVVFQNISLKLK